MWIGHSCHYSFMDWSSANVCFRVCFIHWCFALSLVCWLVSFTSATSISAFDILLLSATFNHLYAKQYVMVCLPKLSWMAKTATLIQASKLELKSWKYNMRSIIYYYLFKFDILIIVLFTMHFRFCHFVKCY